MSTVEIKKTTLITTSLIVVAMIVFIYWYHVRRIETEKIYIEDCNFKTGDLILFRTTQNFNSVFMANYFTHCGIIIEIEGTPYLFEANGVEKMHLLNHHNRAGMFIPLERLLSESLRKSKNIYKILPNLEYIENKMPY
jgi:hypothetical protein